MYIQDKTFSSQYSELLKHDLVQTLLQTSKEGIGLFNATGEALFLNEHLLDWLQISAAHPCTLAEILQDSEEQQFLLKCLQEKNPPRTPLNLSLRSAQGIQIPVQVKLSASQDPEIWLLNVSDLRREWQLEATLSESLLQHHQLLHALPVPVVIVHRADGAILQGNEEFANWYGIPDKSLAAHPLSDFLVHPSDWLFLVEELKRRHNSCIKDIQVYNPDGSRAWSRTLAQTITFDGYPAIVLVFHEMTQSKQLEKAMAWNSLLLKAMMTTLSQFVANIDSETLFLHILDYLLSMTYSEFGFILALNPEEPEEICLMSVDHKRWNVDTIESFARSAQKEFEKLHRDQHPFVRPLFHQKLELEQIQDENHFPWVRQYMGIPLFSSGQLVGMVGLANSPYPYDEILHMELNPLLVTTGHILAAWRNDQLRQKAEQQLRQSNRQLTLLHQDLSELVANSAAPIFALNLHGLITTWNDAAIALTGYQQEEITTGLLLLQLVNPDQHSELELSLQRIRTSGSHESLELTLQTTENKRRQLLCGLTPRRAASGEITGIWVVAQDITFLREYQQSLQTEVQEKTSALQRTLFEQRQMTEHLKAMLKKEQSMFALRDKFIALASHEFRTPLTAIQLTADNLSHHSLEDLNEELRTKIQRIKKYADRLHAVADDVLLLTQLENEQILFRPELCELHELLQTITAEVGLTTNHSHQIHLQCPELQVRLDPNLIQQILINLLHNAIKFSPDCTEVWLRAQKTGTELRFEVEDRGLGIKEDEKEQIFQPFYRSESVLFKTSGIGLGLDLVRRALELHRGKIKLHSLEKGSLFAVTIPYRN